MQIGKKELADIIQSVVDTTISALESKGLLILGSASSRGASASNKTAYQRTEQLLFNYRNFQKIVAERKAEIEEIRKYGAPERGSVVVTYSGGNGGRKDLVLDEERKEIAIRNVEKSMESTVQALALIDKGMASLQHDPYYRILELRYFEGYTQEAIAVEFNCTQQTISNNKSRLVKELSVKLFPDKVVQECLV